MDEIVAALRAEQDELAQLVGVAGVDELTQPSACPGWTVADVLLHLAQTNEMAIASVGGRLAEEAEKLAGGLEPVGSIDEWAGAVVDRERGDPEETRDRWLASAEAQAAAFAGADPRARVLWVAGEMAARTLATTRLSETWIHHGDVAAAWRWSPPPSDRLRHIARLAWRTLPYAFARAGRELTGPVAFVLEAPDGSTWTMAPDDGIAATEIRGTALDLCRVAGQRAEAAATDLTGTGPDVDPVLELVRTFA